MFRVNNRLSGRYTIERKKPRRSIARNLECSSNVICKKRNLSSSPSKDGEDVGILEIINKKK
jgi:hypothetical protein